MILRYASALLLFTITLCGALDVKVLKTKPIGKKGNKFALKGSCTYRVTEAIESAKLTMQFDKSTMNFKSGKVSVVSSEGNSYLLENKKTIKPKKFKVVFSLQYTGSEVPAGTCSDLQVITTTSTTTTKTTTTTVMTTQAPATTDSGTGFIPVEVISDWLESGNLRRMNAKCVFTFASDVQASDLRVNLTFNSATQDFEDWTMTRINSDPSGYWYFSSNTWNINSGVFVYDFLVSYAGEAPPAGGCYSNYGGNGGGGPGPTDPPATTPGKTVQPTTTTPWNNSSPFNYADVIRRSILFYAAQRSGPLPADNPIPWRGDSALGDQGMNGEDLTGGWYDAGDNVKFNFPMASSVTLLALGLYRWPEAYEAAGQTDKMLDCIKWPLDYLLKCWNDDSSSPLYYAQVGDGDLDHAFWVRPEDVSMERPAYYLDKTRPGSDVTAETAAAFAIGSLVFKMKDQAYSNKLLKAAKSLYDFADNYRGKYSDSIPEVQKFYKSWSGYNDELMFSSLLLYMATGDSSYVSKARQAHVDGKYDDNNEKAWALSWDDKRIAAQLLMYEVTKEAKYRTLVDNFLDRYRGSGTDAVVQTPGGLAWRDTWGSLRYAGNAAFLALMAADAGIQPSANRQWAVSQINYILGNNPRSSSYVVGFGKNYPKQPHHRAASCPNRPATCDWSNYNYNGPNPQVIHGALVGGPDSTDNYIDKRSDFQMNEVACDYNSGFQSALAGVVQLSLGINSTFQPPTAGPTQPPATGNSPKTSPPATKGPTTNPPTEGYNYNIVLKKSILFYAAQRSGDLPEGAANQVPWRGDSALYDGQDVGLDLTGGWYDAGDYVKFNFPISSATAVLAWGLVQWRDAYEAAGQLDEMLDSIKWSLDYYLKCWKSDTLEYYAQVGNGVIDHDWMGRPEDMTIQRPAYKVTKNQPGSDVAASTTAAFAAGSIAFKQTDSAYSTKLLDAAKSLYDFADEYRGIYTNAVSDAGQFYPSSGYKDELLYAAAMLYKATGQQKYLADAENKYQEFGFDYQTSWAFDWSDKLMGAKLLLFEATNNPGYSRDVTSFLNSWRPGGGVQYTSGGLAWRSQWGSLRYSANTAFIALMSADLGINPSSNINWARGQIHYMLGDNPRQSSYVVGFGKNPPKRPHHKSSVCQPSPAACNWNVFNADTDNAHVLQGALVGGPNNSDQYVDDRKDYIMAEVTCDYNAGFQSAVAGLQHFKLQK